MLQVIDDDGDDRRGRRCEHFAAVRTRRPATSASTRRRRGRSSARRCGRPTARCGSTARCRRKGAQLRLSAYRTGGGGAATSRAARSGCSRPASRTSPGSRTGRRRSAAPTRETIDDAKLRGPLVLRSRGRAVTAEDFEELAREVAPEAARVHCVPRPGRTAGGVRVLVVPHVASDDGRPDRAARTSTRCRSRSSGSAGYLDERRLVGTRLVVEPPDYQWLTVVVSVRARARYRAGGRPAGRAARAVPAVRPAARRAGRHGWPFGRAVQAHEVYAALARVPGVDMAEEVSVQLFPADPATGRARAGGRSGCRWRRTALVFSYEHQVRVPLMSGGLVPGLASPHPLGQTLPALYLDDSFAQRAVRRAGRGAGAGHRHPGLACPPTSTRRPRRRTCSPGWPAGWARAGRPPDAGAAAGARPDRGRAAAVARHRAGVRAAVRRPVRRRARAGRVRRGRAVHADPARRCPAATARTCWSGCRCRPGGLRPAPAGRAGRDGQAGAPAAPGRGAPADRPDPPGRVGLRCSQLQLGLRLRVLLAGPGGGAVVAGLPCSSASSSQARSW